MHIALSQLGCASLFAWPLPRESSDLPDPTPNCKAECRWQKRRREGMPSSQLEVLDTSHEIWEHGYSKEHVISGWKRIGLVHKAAVNGNVVLLERHSERRCPLKKRQWSRRNPSCCLVVVKDMSGASATLPSCEACLKQTPTSLPLCGHCRSQSPRCSPVKAAISAGAKAGGFSRQQEPLADQVLWRCSRADEEAQRRTRGRQAASYTCCDVSKEEA